MDKDKVLLILYELYDDYQFMREQGEHDMRIVLHNLDLTIKEIKRL